MSSVRGSGEMSSLAFVFHELSTKPITKAEAQPIFKYIARWYGKKRKEIPKDTGALQKSLTRRSDRKHIEGVNALPGGGVELYYGSSLKQAIFQYHRIPKIDGAASEYIKDRITWIIWSKMSGRWMGKVGGGVRWL